MDNDDQKFVVEMWKLALEREHIDRKFQNTAIFRRGVQKGKATLSTLKAIKDLGRFRLILGGSFISFEEDKTEANLLGCAVDVHKLPEGSLTLKNFEANLRNPTKDSELPNILFLSNNDIDPNNVQGVLTKISQTLGLGLVCVWDWDCHHTVNQSCLLAMHSDIYYAADPKNLYFISRLNPLYSTLLYCGTGQWSSSDVISNFELIMNCQRSENLYGRHIRYEGFTDRNSIIETLSTKYPCVAFSAENYFQIDKNERLREWVNYKTHIIAPVNHGIPIRLFDSLITGGVPVVPKDLELVLESLGIAKHCIFYRLADLWNFRNISEAALKKFDHEGVSGIIDRVLCGLKNHVTKRIYSAINFALS